MGGDPDAQLVLLRFSGDLHTKARATRHQFVRRLLRNLRDAIASEGLAPRVRLSHNRIFVELPVAASVGPLTRVFGIQSLSRVAERVPADLPSILRTGLALFAEPVRGRRFAVRARHVGNKSAGSVSVREVERELGAALLPHADGVDLGSPDVTVPIELIDGEAYFLHERETAPGGLPLGVEGHALALLSGGFDSAVAAWQMLRRGVSIDYVFCNLGGELHRLGVLRVAKLMADRWHYGEHPRLHCIEFEAVVEQLRTHTTQRYWQVLLKRLMLRAAAQVAAERKAAAVVTGEAVGQVSSQTLQNLAVISQATDVMVLRPLVGTNKQEIIRTANEIGTFELSKLVGEYCDLVPRRPATAAALDVVQKEEALLDLGVLEAAVTARDVFDLRRLEGAGLASPDLEVSGVPDGAVVIDLRPRAQFDSWHHPDALHLEFAQAQRAWPSFDRQQTYVLYCDFGLLSGHLAEMMRREGFQAVHFKGGTRALRKTPSTAER